MKKVFLALLSLVIVLGITNSASAASEQGLKNKNLYEKIKNDSDFTIVGKGTDGNFSFAPKKGISKKYFLSKLEGINALGVINLDAEKVVSYNGGTYDAVFNSSFDHKSPWFQNETIEIDGSSYERWLVGGNADQIITKDIFTFGTSSGSMTITVPPSFTHTYTSDSFTIEYPVLYNNFYYQHAYSGIIVEAGNFDQVSQSHQATFLVGNTTYTVSAYDTSIVN